MASSHRLTDLEVSTANINNHFKAILPQFKQLMILKTNNDKVLEQLRKYENEGFKVVPKTKSRVEEYDRTLTNQLCGLYNKSKEIEALIRQLSQEAHDAVTRLQLINKEKQFITRSKMVAVRDYTSPAELKTSI